jgi:hypothetical protein
MNQDLLPKPDSLEGHEGREKPNDVHVAMQSNRRESEQPAKYSALGAAGQNQSLAQRGIRIAIAEPTTGRSDEKPGPDDVGTEQHGIDDPRVGDQQ